MQSANGVRVNGEEYGKVELRKGDQIDLATCGSFSCRPARTSTSATRSSISIARVRRSSPSPRWFFVDRRGGAAFWRINRPPLVDAESEAAKLLVDVDSDMQAKRWADAIAKSNRVMSNPRSGKLRDNAATQPLPRRRREQGPADL